MSRVAASLIACLAVTGCAKSSAMQLSADTMQITTSAAPVCGAAGAQQVASRRAAVETIRRGYDKYLIVDGAYRNDVRVVGHTPVVARTSGSVSAYGNTAYGRATTTYSGGEPIVGGSHTQGLIVKMFKADDPAGANAVPARESLGPDWKKAVQEGGAGVC